MRERERERKMKGERKKKEERKMRSNSLSPEGCGRKKRKEGNKRQDETRYKKAVFFFLVSAAYSD